jgi:hypothetical protein
MSEADFFLDVFQKLEMGILCVIIKRNSRCRTAFSITVCVVNAVSKPLTLSSKFGTGDEVGK